MNKINIILILFLFSVVFSACTLSKKININFLDINKYKIVETYENSNNKLRVMYEYNNNFLKIDLDKNINIKDSESFKNEKVKNFLDIYKNNIAPYPGELSNVSICNKEFMPEEIIVNNVLFYKAFLNNRYQFGSCVEDQLKYKGVKGFLFCKNKNEFYQIEYFVDKKTLDIDKKINDFINSIKCD